MLFHNFCSLDYAIRLRILGFERLLTSLMSLAGRKSMILIPYDANSDILYACRVVVSQGSE
jgi:hypothetical protein